MERILIKKTSSKEESIKPNLLRSKKVTCMLDEYLLVKLRNIIKGEQASGQFKYGSVSEIIRASLQSYQNNPQITQTRQLGKPRIAYTFCLSVELYQLYQSWPLRQRTASLENIILTYLNTI